MNRSLLNLEGLILNYVKENYLPRSTGAGWTFQDTRFFLKGVEELSDSFTRDRGERHKNYLNKKEARSAYLLYFTLTNFAKTYFLLDKILPFLPQGGLKILDLGCGPGTGALALSSYFQNSPLEILSVDQNKNILKDAYHLFNQWRKPNHHLQLVCEDFHPKNLSFILKNKKFDLILAVNVFNEFKSLAEQNQLATQLQNHLTPEGILLLIDPALQKTTRPLMELRDQLLAKQKYRVLAPCLHQANCPMLAFNKRDWCHFYIDWKCPKIIREFDRELRNKHDYLKMAYLVLKNGLTPAPSISHQGGGIKEWGIWRVVSSPLVSNGKVEFNLCGGKGELKKIRRLNKHRSPQNKDFDRMKRGDLVTPRGDDQSDWIIREAWEI